MTEKDFLRTLDKCIARLQSGESVGSILDSYPQHAQRLRPLLRAAAHGRELPKPEARRKARVEGKGRVLAAVKAQQRDGKFPRAETKAVLPRITGRMIDWLKTLFVNKENTDMKFAYRAVVYSLITVVIGGVFAVNTSAKSLPGEPLYGVKRGWEQARLAFTFSAESEQELEEAFEAERLEEVSALVAERRQAEVEFEGMVDSVEGDLWVIGGFAVLVDEDTEISGDPAVGSRVEVEGRTQEDGTILAFELETVTGDDLDEDDEDDDMEGEDREEYAVYGTLENLSDRSATVDGVIYVINGESEIGDDLQMGDSVKVKYYEDENGKLIVLEIELDKQELDTEGDDLDDEDDEDDLDEDEGDDLDEDGDDGDMDDEDEEGHEAVGTLENLSEDSLVVNGVIYLLDGDSEVEEGLAVGDTVQVEFYENENGDLVVLDIERDDDDLDTPSPNEDESDDDDEDDEDDEHDEDSED